MGNELGQLQGRDKKEQDWQLKKPQTHTAFHSFFRDQNLFYITYPALWELDGSREGFQ